MKNIILIKNQTTHFTFIAVVALALIAISHNAYSHPHDLLAQCQLPNGKWVMCDQTTHDLASNAHVEKSRIKKIGSLKARATRSKQLKTQATNNFRQIGVATHGASGMPKKLGIPFATNCANGFSKAGEQKFPNGDLQWYVCTTQTLTCPSYVQSNGKKAYVTPKAIVQLIGANPDGGEQKFRVQYKCEYSFNAHPVP